MGRMSNISTEDTKRDFSAGGSRGNIERFPSLSCPYASDGAEIWRLVREDGTLERNSAYAYMLLGAHFGGTSVVARADGQIVGFVWSYLLPERPDTVFVWQIGVAAASRSRGLAAAMLREMLSRPACSSVAFVEATVTPSNRASLALFRSFARKRNAPLDLSAGFDSSAFPDSSHESEMLVRIGPIVGNTKAGSNSKE
jgi:L-2,4-diaminobutyric acid acetyltransferase